MRRNSVECAIAIVWPEGKAEPVCEMFRVDFERMEWTSKHYSDGASFDDGGRLRDGETARSLAQLGTRSGIFRYSTAVTFVVADLDVARFDSTRPTEWTVDDLARLPNADVSRHEPGHG
jgi:hypothetical protein